MKKVSALPVFRVVLPAVQFDDEFRRTRPDGGCELSFLHPSFDDHELRVPCPERGSRFRVVRRGPASFERRAPPGRVEIRVPAAERRNALQPARPTFTRRKLGG